MKAGTLRPKKKSLLDRLLDPLARSLSPAAARTIVNFRADPETVARVAELSEKCNEGEMNAEERAEYDSYINAADLIAILQSKARIRCST